MKKQNTTTIYDIAKHCGLSKSTVAYIISGSPKYKASEKSKKLVKKAMKELNYRPNLTARNLRTNRTNSIGVIVITLKDMFFAELVENLQLSLSARGYTGIFSFPKTEEQVKESLNYFISKGVDGIINSAWKFFDIVDNQPLPIVYYGNRENPYQSYVYTDVCEVIDKSVEHLHSLGHSKIAFLGYSHPGTFRFEAYKKALNKFNIPYKEEYVKWTNIFYDGGTEGLEYYMGLNDPPTAIICQNDPMAIGVISKANRIGLKIPEELSVIGGNNIIESQYTSPALTTFDFPVEDISNELCDLIIEQIETNSSVHTAKAFKAQMLLRDSTGPVPVK
jgi:DNA-binding LacI/PurR family transcriptional regulator